MNPSILKQYNATLDEFVSTALINSLSKLTDKELESFYLLSDSVKNHQKAVKVSTSSAAKPMPTVNVTKPKGTTSFQTIFQRLFSRNESVNNIKDTTQLTSIHKTQLQSSPCEKLKCDTEQTTNLNVKRKTNYGIMKTNSFTIEIQVSKCVITPAQKRKIIKVTENRLALFPTISRLNHSCQPNCNHYWCGQAGKFMIRAVR